MKNYEDLEAELKEKERAQKKKEEDESVGKKCFWDKKDNREEDKRK